MSDIVEAAHHYVAHNPASEADIHIVALIEEIERLRGRAERLRLELEKIGWMDEFLDADGARAMMKIAREAVGVDENESGTTSISRTR